MSSNLLIRKVYSFSLTKLSFKKIYYRFNIIKTVSGTTCSEILGYETSLRPMQ